MREVESQYEKINNRVILYNIYWFLVSLVIDTYILTSKGYY